MDSPYDHYGWPMASTAGLWPAQLAYSWCSSFWGEPMLARNGQWDGQDEYIMPLLQAMLSTACEGIKL